MSNTFYNIQMSSDQRTDADISQCGSESPRRTKKIFFDGKSLFVTSYTKRQFNYENLEQCDVIAEEVCDDLFSGPCPEVGWWIQLEDKQEKSTQIIDPRSRKRRWRPRAIISITGGAESFDPTDKQRKKITQEIMKAAKAMKALIVDGGSSSGIMAAVGEAFEKDGDHVATLGVFPWKAVADRDNIEKGKIYRGISDEKRSRYEANLDRNHRFFALIETEISRVEIAECQPGVEKKEHDSRNAEDGDKNKKADISFWSSEIRARFHIEKVLSRSGPAVSFPHVLIVVNGGFGTIETMHMFCTGRYDILNDSIHTNSSESKKVPLVVVADSGRAANLIVSYLNELSHENNEKNPELQIKEKITAINNDILAQGDQSIKSILEEKNSTDLEKLFSRFGLATEGNPACKLHEYALKIYEICQEKDLITIYNVNSKSSLTSSVMKAVCKMECADDFRKLELLMEWNDPEGLDLMREVLMNGTVDLESQQLCDMLKKALKQNLVKCVELFYDFDIQVPSSTLEELYTVEGSNTVKKKAEHMTIAKDLLNHVFGFTAGTIRLQKCSPVPLQDNKSFAKNISKNRIAAISSKISISDSILPSSETKSQDTRSKPTRDDMLLWSILSGRHELAWFFWQVSGRSRRHHSISRALLASAILRASVQYLPKRFRRIILDGKERPNAEQSECWLQLALKFEQAATDILDLCHKKDPEMAISIVTLPWIHHKDWFLVSSSRTNRLLNPFLLAFAARASSFVAHPAFQECLDRIWYSRIQMARISRVHSGKPLQSRVVSRPNGYRIKHYGLLRWIPWAGGFKWYTLQVNMFLSSILFFPVFFSGLRPAIKENGADIYQSVFKFNLWLKVIGFYSAPCVKFYLDFASYFTFLILYTIVGFRLSYDYTILEGLMHSWIIAMLLRESRDYWIDGQGHLLFGNNYFDVLMLLFYLPAAFLRIYERCKYNEAEFNSMGGFTNETLRDGSPAWYPGIGEEWGKARSWHGIAGIFFWVRIVDYFRASRKLGPLMLVLAKVTRDALQFFVVLLVFIISFGAAIICASRPRDDPSESIRTYFTKAIFLPFFEIFGEHFLDSNTLSIGNHPMCTEGRTDQMTCSQHQSLGIVLLCIYLFISSIILMNLLIAMMNSSYDEVLRQSTSTWIFQRVELVLEFSRKQNTPVPLNIILIFFQLKQLFYLPSSWTCWCSEQHTKRSDLEQLQSCFGEDMIRDFSDMYTDDKKMASLYHDLYGEHFWVQDVFEKCTMNDTSTNSSNPGNKEESTTAKADYMRSCAELVTAMCAKRMSQEQEQNAKMQRLKSKTEKDDWDIDINNTQFVPNSFQKKIDYLKAEVDDFKSNITKVIGAQIDSLSRKLAPPAKIRKSNFLLPLPQGAASNPNSPVSLDCALSRNT